MRFNSNAQSPPKQLVTKLIAMHLVGPQPLVGTIENVSCPYRLTQVYEMDFVI
jgi:hypothetical protein